MYFWRRKVLFGEHTNKRQEELLRAAGYELRARASCARGSMWELVHPVGLAGAWASDRINAPWTSGP
jgi:hypothetical protein